MRQADLDILFDYSYWATWQVLDAAASVEESDFVRSTEFTSRDLRGTLVHTLDVEQSWRRRIQGLDKSVWDKELSADRFATASELRAEWRVDATEMRSWLETIDDATLAGPLDLGPKDRFPMWYFLFHIVTHSIEQRRDATTLLRHFGVEPPQLEFLWFADQRGD
jgi:uncharacterized damage-inducible protein DinB